MRIHDPPKAPRLGTASVAMDIGDLSLPVLAGSLVALVAFSLIGGGIIAHLTSSPPPQKKAK